MSGVYEIRNEINRNCYIGSSVALDKRLRGHKNRLEKGLHKNPHLQNAYNKYGKSAFVFKILLYCDPKNVLLYEQILMDNFNPRYNISSTAGNTTGCFHSIATRKKMSKAGKGRKFSKEHKERISKALMGHKQTCFNYSAERNQKISLALMGHGFSEETRRKMSVAGRNPRPWAQGRCLSDETKQKISKAHKGKHLSDETKQKISMALKGRIFSEEHRQKIGEANKGRFYSEKTRQKLRDALAIRRAKLNINQI